MRDRGAATRIIENGKRIASPYPDCTQYRPAQKVVDNYPPMAEKMAIFVCEGNYS